MFKFSTVFFHSRQNRLQTFCRSSSMVFDDFNVLFVTWSLIGLPHADSVTADELSDL